MTIFARLLTLVVIFSSPVTFAGEDLYSDYQNYIDGIAYPDGDPLRDDKGNIITSGFTKDGNFLKSENGFIYYPEDPESDARRQLSEVPLHEQEIVRTSTKEILDSAFAEFAKELKDDNHPLKCSILTKNYRSLFNKILESKLMQLEHQDSGEIDLAYALIACDETRDCVLERIEQEQSGIVAECIEKNDGGAASSYHNTARATLDSLWHDGAHLFYACVRIKNAHLGRLDLVQVRSFDLNTGKEQCLHETIDNCYKDISFIISPDNKTMIINEYVNLAEGSHSDTKSQLYVLNLATGEKSPIGNKELYDKELKRYAWYDVTNIEYLSNNKVVITTKVSEYTYSADTPKSAANESPKSIY